MVNVTVTDSYTNNSVSLKKSDQVRRKHCTYRAANVFDLGAKFEQNIFIRNKRPFVSRYTSISSEILMYLVTHVIKCFFSQKEKCMMVKLVISQSISH